MDKEQEQLNFKSKMNQDQNILIPEETFSENENRSRGKSAKELEVDPVKKIISVLQKNKFKLISELNEEQQELEMNQSLSKGMSSINLQGIHTISNSQVNIKISNSFKQSYEIIKKESYLLRDMDIFDSVLKYVDGIDLKEENIFILITESYEESMQDIINRNINSGLTYELSYIVNVFFSLINSLCEIHSKNIIHNNITSHNIVKDKSGNFKFKDFINSSNLLEIQHVITEENLSLLPPEIAQKEDYKTSEIMQYSDIYSLGLVMLQLIGLELNNNTLELIHKEQFIQVKQLIVPQYRNMGSFICLYMLNSISSLRLSSSQLKKNIYKFYENVYLRKDLEIQRIKNILKRYEENKKPLDNYYGFLACVLLQLDKNQENEQFFNLAIEQIQQIKELNFENNHFLHIEVGITYIRLQQFQKALQVIENSMQLQRENKSVNNYLTIQSINNLGNCYFYLEKYKEALEYYEKALSIRQNYYDKDHSLISDLMRNCGLCYLQLQNVQQSIQCQEKALQIREMWFEGDHYLIAESSLDLGDCYQSLNQKEKTLKYNQKALNIYENLYQVGNKQISDALSNMGIYYFYEDKYQESLNYFTKSLVMNEQTYGINSTEIVSCLRNVALCCRMLRQYQEALNHYKRGLAIRQIHFKGDNIFIAESLFDIASCYSQIGDEDQEFYYVNKHLDMLIALKQIDEYYFQNLLNLIENISNIHKQLEFMIKTFKKYKHMAKAQRAFIKQLLTLIHTRYELNGDSEESQQYQILLLLEINKDL